MYIGQGLTKMRKPAQIESSRFIHEGDEQAVFKGFY
jgi:hypothetical protein